MGSSSSDKRQLEGIDHLALQHAFGKVTVAGQNDQDSCSTANTVTVNSMTV
ncbi:hypothetical protein [Chitinimonas lacunae]|uniref:Uncharacterized protein n=1 Tax=Chitinimonas lacunae TaxID=1963018 RepID=A0ABV8MR51_9NEIS